MFWITYGIINKKQDSLAACVIVVRKELMYMRYTIIGKNIEVTEGLKTAVQDKIGKLERYFDSDTEIHATLAVEKDRQKK